MDSDERRNRHSPSMMITINDDRMQRDAATARDNPTTRSSLRPASQCPRTSDLHQPPARARMFPRLLNPLFLTTSIRLPAGSTRTDANKLTNPVLPVTRRFIYLSVFALSWVVQRLRGRAGHISPEQKIWIPKPKISYWLANPIVRGTCVITDGGKSYELPDHYPPVIDEATWAAARPPAVEPIHILRTTLPDRDSRPPALLQYPRWAR